MRVTLFVAIWLVIGCSSNETTKIDAQVQPDGTGAACTGAVYDPCTDNAQCMSGNCHLYGSSNFQVCIQACTPGDNSTCPVDSTGQNGFCNNMGLCKPAQPNACTR